MGRYVTPRGVEVEVSDTAARNVGYKPVESASEPKKAPAKKAPAKRAAKSDSK